MVNSRAVTIADASTIRSVMLCLRDSAPNDITVCAMCTYDSVWWSRRFAGARYVPDVVAGNLSNGLAWSSDGVHLTRAAT